MNKREAWAYAVGFAATVIENTADVFTVDELSDADQERVEKAFMRLAQELYKREARLKSHAKRMPR